MLKRYVILLIAVLFITGWLYSWDVAYSVKLDGSGDFTNISDAVDAVQNGQIGRIHVFGPGLYTGSDNKNIYWNGSDKHIQIVGFNNPIIDCGNNGRFAYITNGTEEDIIKNLTITNANSNYQDGGALYINGGNPIIEGNTFESCITGCNHAAEDGGAIYVSSGNGVIIRNNSFIENSAWSGGAIYISNSSDASIENNDFISNTCITTGYPGHAGYAGALKIWGGANHIIVGNYFEDNRSQNGAAVMEIFALSVVVNSNVFESNVREPLGSLGAGDRIVYIYTEESEINYNLFSNNYAEDRSYNVLEINYQGEEDIVLNNNSFIGNSSPLGYLYDNSSIAVSSYYGTVNTKINNCLFANNDGVVYDGGNVTFRHTLTYNNVDLCDSNTNCDIGPGCLIEIDPKLDQDYKPIWNSQTFSPVIDAGDPELPWDPDDTPPDIGAVRADWHDFHYTISIYDPSSPDRYYWRSFPVLDRIYGLGEEALYVLEPVEEQSNNFTLFDQDNSRNVWDGEVWDPVQLPYLDSTIGYKISSNHYFSIPTPGIKQHNNTQIELDTGENWIGYFILDTLSIDVALEDIWDNLEAVYSEDWAWNASGPTIPPEKATMEYGKMYKIFVEEPCEFVYRTGDPVPPNQRTMTEGFSYSETPMYSVIMIDDIDDPEAVEIGVFQDDVCIGATQIEDEPVQILAFPQDSSRSNLGGNIHFELYYGQRSENKRIRNFSVRNPDGCAGSRLSLVPYRFNYVTLDSEPDEPITQLTTTNYPNPFNPETTISYSLPNDTHVEIEIFNIKGQLVKRLVDGEQPAGSYQTVWNGINDNGRSVGSGVYFYRITTDEKIIREKMLLLK